MDDVTAAKKKNKKPLERVPGVLNAKLKKGLGNMAEVFESVGIATYETLVDEVKKAAVMTLSNKKAELYDQVRQKFGEYGVSEAGQYLEAWADDILADIFSSGTEHVREAVSEITSTPKGVTSSARMLELARKSIESGIDPKVVNTLLAQSITEQPIQTRPTDLETDEPDNDDNDDDDEAPEEPEASIDASPELPDTSLRKLRAFANKMSMADGGKYTAQAKQVMAFIQTVKE